MTFGISRPSAVCIGNFDGVHIGHQRLLRTTVERARALGAKPTALTFDPHPSNVVAPERTPRLLTTIEERCARMREFGIEQVLALPFTMEIARLSPEEFVHSILVEVLGSKSVIVGENFRFGHKQSGDTRVLAELGARYGFDVCVEQPVTCRGEVVSSSSVRSSIEAGEVGLAWRYLGRPYSLAGEVVHGRGVGSKQTVPTLNLKTAAEVLPRVGVYVTRTTDGSRRWNSISNIGYRPTFADGAPELSIETFLLGPLVGEPPQQIEVEFLHRVRDERKFEDAEALKSQILRDVGRALAWFRHWERNKL